MPQEKIEAKCPVCGKDVEITEVGKLYGAASMAKRVTSSTYKGKTYYFDTKACKRKFDENPEQFVKE